MLEQYWIISVDRKKILSQFGLITLVADEVPEHSLKFKMFLKAELCFVENVYHIFFLYVNLILRKGHTEFDY